MGVSTDTFVPNASTVTGEHEEIFRPGGGGKWETIHLCCMLYRMVLLGRKYCPRCGPGRKTVGCFEYVA